MSGPRWLTIAASHIGTREIAGPKHNAKIIGWLQRLKSWIKDDETPWCGTFCAAVMQEAGLPYPKEFPRAKAWADYGANLRPTHVAPGAILVFSRDGGGHVGFNLCPGRVCIGAYFEGGWSNGETTFADVDVLKFNAYRPIGALIGSTVGKSTFVDIHGGYEWQDWEATDGSSKLDIDVAMWVLGAGVQTLVTDHMSFGVKLDYLVLDSAEAGRGVGDLTKYLDQTEALRAQVKLTYYPEISRTSLESLVRR